MENLKEFEYKLYRHDLACNLKKIKGINRNDAKKILEQEQSTIQYSVAKLVKLSVNNKVKSNNQLDIIVQQNNYLDEEEKLVRRIRRNPKLFTQLDKRLKSNHSFVLKLLTCVDFSYSDLFPNELLGSKSFILKAIEIDPYILDKIDEDLKSDNDIINKTKNTDKSFLSYLKV